MTASRVRGLPFWPRGSRRITHPRTKDEAPLRWMFSFIDAASDLPDLRADISGTALVEFALLAPTLIALCIGSYETANLILADLKLEAAAETAPIWLRKPPSSIRAATRTI